MENVKKVSIREFRLNASAYLKEIPVVLTQYNVPKYILLTLSEYEGMRQGSNLNDGAPKGNTHVYASVNTSVNGICKVKNRYGMVCGKEATAMGKMWDGEELVDVPMCKEHAAKSLKESL